MEEKKLSLWDRLLKLNWTTSKILSFLIFGSGCVISFYLKDKDPFMEGIMYATINQGAYNITGYLKDLKTIKK